MRRLLFTLITLALFGCGSQHEPVPLPQSLAERASVPAGRTFEVELQDRLSTESSPVGQPFSAVTVVPLEAADRTRIARAGARLTGHLTAVDPRRASMQLAFDWIETDRGRVPLRATLAGEQKSPALRIAIFAGPGPGYDAVIGLLPPMAAVGGGPPEMSEPLGADELTLGSLAVPRGSAITLEAASRIRLLLTQPLGLTSP